MPRDHHGRGRFTRLALLVIAAGATIAAQAPATFEAVVQPFAADGRFMGAALVARGDEVVFSRIFTPVGMTDSGYDSNTAIIPRRAAGYSRGPNGPTNARYVDMSVPHAAGALYSTTGDLHRWMRALFGGKVLSAASLRKMTTPNLNNYAMGLLVRDVGGRPIIGHGGSINGFNAFLLYVPDSEVTVAVLANINGNAPQQIAMALATAAMSR